MFKTPVYYSAWPRNGHLKEIERHFGPIAAEQLNVPNDMKFIFLCFTNRSGSNYLAELMASDGQLPNAGENLNSDTILNHSKNKNLGSFREYFEYLVNRIKKNNFVSIKIAPPHFEILGKSGILEQIIDRSYFVVVERSDKLGQAISHLIAFQTGKFTSLIEDQSAPSTPEFDAKKLDGIIEGICNSYHYFSMFFAKNGIVPVNVVYEQIAHDPSKALSFIGENLGLQNLTVNPAHLRLEKQAGELNKKWRQEYLLGKR